MCTLFCKSLRVINVVSPYGLHGVHIYILYLYDQMWLVRMDNNSVHMILDNNSVYMTRDNNSVYMTRNNNSMHMTQDHNSEHMTPGNNSMHMIHGTTIEFI